jgi:hypothetical protein
MFYFFEDSNFSGIPKGNEKEYFVVRTKIGINLCNCGCS